jgi:hypothetical protein
MRREHARVSARKGARVAAIAARRVRDHRYGLVAKRLASGQTVGAREPLAVAGGREEADADGLHGVEAAVLVDTTGTRVAHREDALEVGSEGGKEEEEARADGRHGFSCGVCLVCGRFWRPQNRASNSNFGRIAEIRFENSTRVPVAGALN